ncbi:MAG: hypothetical protein PHY47_00435 [Lachnospiraceae bacterium]|nr:hypothetical protein [Lachnospiraceae bacterium]
MKLFLDKKSGEYKVKVNSSSPEKNITAIYAPRNENGEIKDNFDPSEVIANFNDKLDDFRFIWDNNGMAADGVKWRVEDMYATPDAPWMLPKIVSEVALDAIEPQLLMTSMMQRIGYTMGQQIVLPMMSEMSQVNLDMQEGDEYAETKLAHGSTGYMQAQIGKVGLAVKITEEMIRYSQFDVIGMHIKHAGKMLARHKETKAWNMVAGQGVVYFDNLNPAASELGVTHGRNRDGSGNGSLIADDLLELDGHLVAKGFVPNTMILHPLTYTMFRKDPVMRTLFFNGQSTTYFGTYKGSAQGGNPWLKAGGMGLGKQQKIKEDSETKLRNKDIDSQPVFPAYWGMDLQIMVSPHVKYDPIKKLTDIIICDRNELGVLLVDEELTTEEWTDPARDIKKIKFRERYNFGILNEGQSVAILRNVKNVENKIVDRPAEPTYDVGTVNLADLPKRSPVV